MRNKYLYKNIIRKQKMLNEKHEDIIKQKNRGVLQMKQGDIDGSLFSNSSKLFTSKYLHELEYDSSYINKHEIHEYEAEYAKRHSGFAEFVKRKQAHEAKFPSRQKRLHDLLNSFLMKESELANSKTLQISDLEDLNIELPSKHDFAITLEVEEDESIVNKVSHQPRVSGTAMKEYSSVQNIKSIGSRLIKQYAHADKAKYDEDSSNWNIKNSYDIKEHPSIEDSKIQKNPTSEKYKKYMGKRRSASRGVFTSTDNSENNGNVLKEPKPKYVMTCTPTMRDSDAATEVCPNHEVKASEVMKQKVRHERTKTLLGELRLNNKFDKEVYPQPLALHLYQTANVSNRKNGFETPAESAFQTSS